MSISGISGQSMYQTYQQLSSGSQINSAADDAAGLAIAEKMENQTNGYDVGTRNAADAQNMLKVADGGLAGISDQLNRIRELSIQASNTAVYGNDDRELIQNEIEQLKESISDIASNTEFNTKKLLDGTMPDANVASSPDGSGMAVDMLNATLQALGIADYDVTGDFDISVIDNALSKVSAAQSSVGASSNRLDYTMNYNTQAAYNLTASVSSIKDTDYAEKISEMKKQQQLQQYQIIMKKKKQEAEGQGFMKLIQ